MEAALTIEDALKLFETFDVDVEDLRKKEKEIKDEIQHHRDEIIKLEKQSKIISSFIDKSLELNKTFSELKDGIKKDYDKYKLKKECFNIIDSGDENKLWKNVDVYKELEKRNFQFNTKTPQNSTNVALRNLAEEELIDAVREEGKRNFKYKKKSPQNC